MITLFTYKFNRMNSRNGILHIILIHDFIECGHVYHNNRNL